MNVLAEAANDPSTDGGWLFGLDMAERAGLLPGTTYPQFVHLQQRGHVEIKRVSAGQGERFYRRLTPAGFVERERLAAEVMAYRPPLRRLLSWARSARAAS